MVANCFSTEVASLLERHHQYLLASGISLEVIKERGYESVLGRKRLADLGFSKAQQQVPTILIPLYGVDGKQIGYQLPPEDVVEKELEDTIDSKLGDDVKEMVREAIEKLLGATIADIEEEVEHEIGVPAANGYYDELKEFLNGCPPEYWRDWISGKATGLEEAHIKGKKSLVSEFLSQRLERRSVE